MTAADRLRQAADLLEQRAATAPPDIWRLARVRESLDKWVALMTPDLAGPFAAWLRTEADHAELLAALDEPAPGTVRVRLSTAAEALAVADVICGGAQ